MLNCNAHSLNKVANSPLITKRFHQSKAPWTIVCTLKMLILRLTLFEFKDVKVLYQKRLMFTTAHERLEHQTDRWYAAYSERLSRDDDVALNLTGLVAQLVMILSRANILNEHVRNLHI